MVDDGIDAVFRRESGRVLGTLIRLLGDFELAEEALQDAFAAAIEAWTRNGAPDNPRAWLIHVGRLKGIDRLRRRILQRRTLQDMEADAQIESALRDPAADSDHDIDDDLLPSSTEPGFAGRPDVACRVRPIDRGGCEGVPAQPRIDGATAGANAAQDPHCADSL